MVDVVIKILAIVALVLQIIKELLDIKDRNRQ
jgi:hypothetical protein